MRLYLSGPMAGYPDDNFPLFHKAAGSMRAEGHCVYNPADYCVQVAQSGQPFNIRQAFDEYCTYICNCADGIVVLPGWEASKGATVEVLLARRIGLPVFRHDGTTWIGQAPEIANMEQTTCRP